MPGTQNVKPVFHLQFPLELLTDSGRAALSRGETVACRGEAIGSNFRRHRISVERIPARELSETYVELIEDKVATRLRTS
jgi:uroporphyrinogen-III synthase